MVTFLAAGHHLLLTTTKLYCFVTEVRARVCVCVCVCVCEQLAEGCYLKWNRQDMTLQCCITSVCHVFFCLYFVT